LAVTEPGSWTVKDAGGSRTQRQVRRQQEAVLQATDRKSGPIVRGPPGRIEGEKEREEVIIMAKTFDELVKRTTTKKTRARAAVRTQELLAELLLSEVRQLTGKSQHQVAEILGIKQPSLSKLEKQSDMQISTLQKIVKALGGELEVLAKFPKGTVKIDQFDRSHRRPGHLVPQELQLS